MREREGQRREIEKKNTSGGVGSEEDSIPFQTGGGGGGVDSLKIGEGTKKALQIEPGNLGVET